MKSPMQKYITAIKLRYESEPDLKNQVAETWPLLLREWNIPKNRAWIFASRGTHEFFRLLAMGQSVEDATLGARKLVEDLSKETSLQIVVDNDSATETSSTEFKTPTFH